MHAADRQSDTHLGAFVEREPKKPLRQRHRRRFADKPMIPVIIQRSLIGEYSLLHSGIDEDAKHFMQRLNQYLVSWNCIEKNKESNTYFLDCLGHWKYCSDDQRIKEGAFQAGDATLVAIPSFDIGDNISVKPSVGRELIRYFYCEHSASVGLNLMARTRSDQLFPIGQQRYQIEVSSSSGAFLKHVASGNSWVYRIFQGAFEKLIVWVPKISVSNGRKGLS
jgi:hypothetical protein